MIQAFLALTALVWLAPLLYTLYTSLRPYSDTAARGYVSLPGTLNLENYVAAWTQADMPQFFWNTIIVTIPAVVFTLLLSSMVAFAVSRFSLASNLTLLIIFTAGNLLPQQVIITPLYRLFLLIPLPEFLSDSGVLFDSYLGIILIHVAFQMGFCVFVLSNYMKTLPRELTEAALVDGTTVWAMYWRARTYAGIDQGLTIAARRRLRGAAGDAVTPRSACGSVRHAAPPVQPAVRQLGAGVTGPHRAAVAGAQGVGGP